MRIVRSTISGNMAKGGGGMYAYESEVTVTDSTISDNVADEYGGGLFIYNAQLNRIVTITNSTIRGNTANFGGGILDNGGQMNLRESTLSGNTANSGGGIYLDAGKLAIVDSIISGNKTTKYSGGGIYAYGGEMTIATSTISGNSTSGDFAVGGGVASVAGKLTVKDSEITDNKTNGEEALGGGIFNSIGFQNNGGELKVSGSTISGNAASGEASSGGGIYTFGGAVEITGSTISGNTATANGGGIAQTDAELMLAHSTISGNTAALGGGLHTNLDSTLRGTIIAGNTADVDDEVHGTLIADFSLIGKATGVAITGIGNLVDDNRHLGPLANNGGRTKTHALLSDSPAIDAGDPDFTPPPEFDQRGAPFDRVVNGRIDIGSFEFGASSADLTGNGFVDFEDLTVLLANWNQNVSAAQGNPVESDATPVNFEDLTVLLAAWTGPGPADSPHPAAAEATTQQDTATTQIHTATSAHFDQRGRRAHRPSRRIDASAKLSSHDTPLRRLQATAVDRAMGEDSTRDQGLRNNTVEIGAS